MTKIKDFFKSNHRIIVAILFVLGFAINIWIVPNKYDDSFFIESIQNQSIFEFVSMRYQTWTSRIIIEFILTIILVQYRLVWIVLNTLMLTLIGYSILKLFVPEDNKKLSVMTLCFILLYPLYKVSTCGWGAGCVNYIWVLALLLFSFIPIKKIFNNEKIKKYMYPLYSIALIFACNQEQACMIAGGIYFVFTILHILENKKKVHPFLIIQSLIVILSIIFIATCPGNYERKTEEIAKYYIDFEMLGIFDKISLGITSTVNDLLVNSNITFFVFSLISSVFIFKKYKNNLYRAVSLIPLVAVLVFGIFKDIFCGAFPYFEMFYEMIILEQPMLTASNYMDPINFVPIIMDLIILGSVALNVLLIFKNLNNNIAILIYILGLGSRVALGFSPTIFASTERTFIFLEFAFIIISILIWKEFLKEKDKSQVKVRDKLSVFIAVMAILQYLHTLIFILISQG